MFISFQLCWLVLCVHVCILDICVCIYMFIISIYVYVYTGPAWEYMYYIRTIQHTIYTTLPVILDHRIHSLELSDLGISVSSIPHPSPTAWLIPWVQSVLCLGMYMSLEKYYHIRYLTVGLNGAGIYYGISWILKMGYIWTTVLGRCLINNSVILLSVCFLIYIHT